MYWDGTVQTSRSVRETWTGTGTNRSPYDHDSQATAPTDVAPGQGSGDVTPVRPTASEGWRLEPDQDRRQRPKGKRCRYNNCPCRNNELTATKDAVTHGWRYATYVCPSVCPDCMAGALRTSLMTSSQHRGVNRCSNDCDRTSHP